MCGDARLTHSEPPATQCSRSSHASAQGDNNRVGPGLERRPPRWTVDDGGRACRDRYSSGHQWTAGGATRHGSMADQQLDGLTNQTVELLQTMIRNAVRQRRDTRVGPGGPQRRRAHRQFLEGAGLEVERYEPTPGRVSIVSRIPGRDPDGAEPVPDGPHRRRARQSQPAGPATRSEGELVDGDTVEVWGRGAVDMLNITSSMAVAFRHLATSGFRPRGDLIYFGVADEEAGSAHGARWFGDNEPDVDPGRLLPDRERWPPRRHPGAAGRRGQHRREGGGLAAAPGQGSPGPRIDAVPVRQRPGPGRRGGPAPGRLPAPTPVHRAVDRAGRGAGCRRGDQGGHARSRPARRDPGRHAQRGLGRLPLFLHPHDVLAQPARRRAT